MGHMNSEHWNKVMRLFTYMILVDGRVFEEEVVCFADMVDYLSRRLPIADRVSRAEAKRWFEQNRASLDRALKHRDTETLIWDSIFDVESFPNKQDLLTVMRQIAHVDGYFHNSEREFVRRAKAHWKLETA